MPIKSCIVSTGGGIVLRNENWSMMSHAVVVWLHGDTSLLARRVVADGKASRPLLADEQVRLQQESTDRQSAHLQDPCQLHDATVACHCCAR